MPRVPLGVLPMEGTRQHAQSEQLGRDNVRVLADSSFYLQWLNYYVAHGLVRLSASERRTVPVIAIKTLQQTKRAENRMMTRVQSLSA